MIAELSVTSTIIIRCHLNDLMYVRQMVVPVLLLIMRKAARIFLRGVTAHAPQVLRRRRNVRRANWPTLARIAILLLLAALTP